MAKKNVNKKFDLTRSMSNQIEDIIVAGAATIGEIHKVTGINRQTIKQLLANEPHLQKIMKEKLRDILNLADEVLYEELLNPNSQKRVEVAKFLKREYRGGDLDEMLQPKDQGELSVEFGNNQQESNDSPVIIRFGSSNKRLKENEE